MLWRNLASTVHKPPWRVSQNRMKALSFRLFKEVEEDI